MNTANGAHRSRLSTVCLVGVCLLTLSCRQSNGPVEAPDSIAPTPRVGPSDAHDSSSDGVAHAHTAAPVPAGTPSATPASRPICPLIRAEEIAAILGAPIGRPAEEDSAEKTSCIYPAADAGSDQQANIGIQWIHGTGLSPEQQLADALNGIAPSHESAHSSALGDDSTYSIDGVLSIRLGNALITIELPKRPNSEEKAVAIGRLLLDRLGRTETKPAVSAVSETPAGTPKFPDGMHVGDVCPEFKGDPHEAESAVVPLKVGLTLSHIWDGGDDNYDHECLVQIVGVTNNYIDITQSCPRGADRRNLVTQRRICREAMRDSYLYRTETSIEEPPTVSPVTMFSLSSRSLHELKTTKSTRHRYIEIDDKWSTRAQPLDRDIDEVLGSTRFDREPYSVVVNERQVELPTVVALGGGNHSWQTKLNVVDDERFPLVLDYEIPGYGLKIRYTKISYPANDDMEKHLALDKHVDVYGIYFDFASDQLRSESTPVLEEIAEVLKKNSGWKLTINGHTDNVGVDASNLDLSRRRAHSVKAALVDRYAVAENRLTIGGFGASQPRDNNNTPEGRARNRRVELTRQ